MHSLFFAAISLYTYPFEEPSYIYPSIHHLLRQSLMSCTRLIANIHRPECPSIYIIYPSSCIRRRIALIHIHKYFGQTYPASQSIQSESNRFTSPSFPLIPLLVTHRYKLPFSVLSRPPPYKVLNLNLYICCIYTLVYSSIYIIYLRTLYLSSSSSTLIFLFISLSLPLYAVHYNSQTLKCRESMREGPSVP